MFGRISDAWNTLLGRRDQVPASRRELEQLRAEWGEVEVQFASMFEKLNAWAARQAKREQRAAAAAIDGLAAEPEEAEVGSGPHSGKAALRRQLFEARVKRLNSRGAG